MSRIDDLSFEPRNKTQSHWLFVSVRAIGSAFWALVGAAALDRLSLNSNTFLIFLWIFLSIGLFFLLRKTRASKFVLINLALIAIVLFLNWYISVAPDLRGF